MDDLLDNFANQSFEPPQSIEPPAEDGYKYHFIHGSPAGSEHAAPAHPAPAASAAPSNRDPLFDIGPPALQQATAGEDEDEGDYNADIDDDDDDYHDLGRDIVSPSTPHHEDLNSGASYNEKSVFENGIHGLDRSIQRRALAVPTTHSANSRKQSRGVEPSVAPSDYDRETDHRFAQYLLRLHGQDKERDELLTKLHWENLDLKRALKESVPGGNSRAEAAERSLFQIRKTMDNNRYVCVLIDGKGNKIHEDLLQLGKKGGFEAADRLRDEVLDHLQQFGDSKYWKILVHIYIDIGGLLARGVSNDIPLSESNVRGFMLGFTQAQPLFTIVDVGHDSEYLQQKMEAMLHLFAKNAQCKHLIFGCCHNSAYTVTLERYTLDPIMASRITLLQSYDTNPSFEGLPFETMEFPRVFRSTPYKETDRLAGNNEYGRDLLQTSSSDRITRNLARTSARNNAGGNEAIAKWQATANASMHISAPARPPAKASSGWGSEKNVLLNINDERVDHELEEVDHETSERMLDHIEVRRFCLFYHLQNSCVAGKSCNFVHGPKLNDHEHRFLKNDSRRQPCSNGSRCRRPDCIYGHVCPDQPGCTKGPKCKLYRFHEVDKTAVRIWSPEKSLSPQKRGSRF